MKLPHLKKPKSKIGRLILGWTLVIGGILGFLPILGFWMIPLGLVILSSDFPIIRRWRRKTEIWFGNKWKRKTAQRNKTPTAE